MNDDKAFWYVFFIAASIMIFFLTGLMFCDFRLIALAVMQIVNLSFFLILYGIKPKGEKNGE